MDKIRVGIVDDNRRLLSSLRDNLSLFKDVEIIWEAGNGLEAIDNALKKPVDHIFMDIEMPVTDGIEATRTIKAASNNDVKIIMLTVFDNSDKIFEAILAGATGYLLKDSPPQKIYDALIEASEGGAPMSPVIASKALQLINKLHSSPVMVKTMEAETDYNLTTREMEILEFITNGLNYNQIADKIFISPKTVRNHIQNIYKKLQITSKAEAINLSHKNNWFKD